VSAWRSHDDAGTSPNGLRPPRYDDAWAAIAFLELCFGFERQTVHEDPNGKVAHAELRLGTASFGLSSANGPVTSDNPWTSVRSGVYVALQDANAVDAHHAHAKAAGAVIAMPLEDTDYGSRQYSVWDGNDRLWCFGTYNHAPLGEPTLFVVLRYPDRPTTARWLAHAFGFEPALTSSASDRSAECTELRLGDSALWLSSAAPDDRLWAKDWHATHLVVPDVDAHYDRAQKSSATVVQSPADAADGARVYWARDAEGHLWSFGTRQPGSSR
jgi:uncharacterized glyoxalase superfamily protein PhnB